MRVPHPSVFQVILCNRKEIRSHGKVNSNSAIDDDDIFKLFRIGGCM